MAARAVYYVCPKVGDGLGTESPFRPTVTPLIAQQGGSWAVCYDDASQYVLVASDLRADGTVAVNLHDDLAADANVTPLGDTFEAAQAAMAAIDPAIAAEMQDAYVPV